MIERRRHRRAPLAGTVVVDRRDATTLGAFRVINLSTGGVLLDGNLACRIGDPLELELRLAGWQPIDARAVLVRQVATRHGRSAALSFLELPRAAERSIEAAMRTALAEATTAPLLIVDLNVDDYYAIKEESQPPQRCRETRR